MYPPDNVVRKQYAKVKQDIDRRFPAGRFVAVEGGQVVADAETHSELVASLTLLGKNPRGLLIVQAGIEYPASATIL